MKETITDLKSSWLLDKFSLSAPLKTYREKYGKSVCQYWCVKGLAVYGSEDQLSFTWLGQNEVTWNFASSPSLVRILYHCRLTSPPLPPIAFFLDKQIDNPNRVKRIFCFCLTLVCVHGAFQENPYHLQAGCCQGLVPPVFQNCTGHLEICGESKKCIKVTFNISPWGWLAS